MLTIPCVFKFVWCFGELFCLILFLFHPTRIGCSRTHITPCWWTNAFFNSYCPSYYRYSILFLVFFFCFFCYCYVMLCLYFFMHGFLKWILRTHQPQIFLKLTCSTMVFNAWSTGMVKQWPVKFHRLPQKLVFNLIVLQLSSHMPLYFLFLD